MKKLKIKKSIFMTLLLLVAMVISIYSYANRNLVNCQNSTVVLTNTIYNNNLNINDTNLTFFTNAVCNATAYEWSIDGFTIAVTRGPSINIDAIAFSQILPLGGCDEFNSRISNGVLSSNLSVRADAGAGNLYTIPVYVSGVQKCKEKGFESKGKGPGLTRGDAETPYGGIGG